MSSSPVWLPPLNSHNNFIINVEANQLKSLKGDKGQPGAAMPRLLIINLQILVSYKPEDSNTTPSFYGLSIKKNCKIPLPVSSNYLRDLISDLLKEPNVQFQLQHVQYVENHLSPEKRTISQPNCDSFRNRIVAFLNDLIENAPVIGIEKVRTSLTVHKAIRVPGSQYKEWMSWYDEQKRTTTDCNFDAKYKRAIGRPRTGGEISEELIANIYKPATQSSIEEMLEQVLDHESEDEDGACTVCLEKLDNGGMPLTRIKCCTNLFHRECIDRWLKTSHTCPICQYKFPTI